MDVTASVAPAVARTPNLDKRLARQQYRSIWYCLLVLLGHGRGGERGSAAARRPNLDKRLAESWWPWLYDEEATSDER